MYSLVSESRTPPGYHSSQENMQAWCEGFLTQTSSSEKGISRELFTQALKVFIDCKEEAIPIWINFAVECVEQEQYVDFFQEPDKYTAINRWLETLLAVLLQVKVEFGEQIASMLCNLALENECLYPYEMLPAAEHYISSGNFNKISDLIQSGELEPASAFFPKLSFGCNDAGLNENISGSILRM